MFEQRILCHKLPKLFDSLKLDHIQEQTINKRNKIIQEMKRQMLHVELEKYENKIQDYEQLYQKELATFEVQLLQTNSSDQKDRLEMLMILLKKYLNHHTKRWMHQIRYEESCLHVKFMRHYRRHISSRNKTIDVYPQIIVDVPRLPLNRIQLDYLSHNGMLKSFPSFKWKLFSNCKFSFH